ncbi:MAG TPA: sialate O-acetylesterase [Bacteroides sp.]|nr:sialate O-acetylesterase [Bacteroides sp.]
MKNHIWISLVLLFLLNFVNAQTEIINESDYPDQIRIACIGNSVTYGHGLGDREQDAYPSRLQEMLGEKYIVRNFGFNGATMLKKGHKPYWEKPPYPEALDFKPHIVIIHLGLNDTDPRNWANFKEEFIPDYREMINVFANMETNPSPKVWICKMSPIFSWHRRFNSGTREDFWAIQDAIEEIAQTEHVTMIDLHTSLYSRPDLFPDAIHPTEEGAGIIAETVKSYITGDFGGLTLPPIFSDHMVMQRQKPVRIFGTADGGEEISLKFAGHETTIISAPDGSWSTEFEAMEAGGPYELSVSTDTTIIINDILMGEVWVCSGQSNMAFLLKREKHQETEVPMADHPEIRLFNFNTVAWPGGGKWTMEEMQKTNRGEYFIQGPWLKCSPETAAEFSAIAYYFGKELKENLGVPVGLIHNAVGGSNTESWIDRKTLEFNPEFVDMLEDWLNNDQVQDWCRGRAAENLADSDNPNQLHPFAPSYLFSTGINPLEKFPFRGVIWYQGESNAEKISQHEKLFTTMVSDWRRFFDDEELPFYYVQLSSLNRPTWPEYRDSQRRLMSEIPNTGMAVCSDIGHPTDVHPKNKKDVGLRLSYWALAKVYNQDQIYSGPLYNSMQIQKKKIILNFDHTGSGLSTSGNTEILGFEIASENGTYQPAKVKIQQHSVILTGKGLRSPTNARYGWKPYTDGNLVNSRGLPASTFSTKK